MSVTYTATLSVREETVLYLSSLPHAERQRRGTRKDRRSLGCFKQAVLVIRWFCDATRVTQLATDNGIGKSTAYDYLHEGITAPDGWPLWTSPVRPGREHDTTAVRTHTEILPLLATIADDIRTLGDLGYEGESDTITVAFKKPKDGELTDTRQMFNKAHNGLRAIGERGNSLLKTAFKALRNVSVCPWKIGNIVAAALVLLHIEHGRTT